MCGCCMRSPSGEVEKLLHEFYEKAAIRCPNAHRVISGPEYCYIETRLNVDVPLEKGDLVYVQFTKVFDLRPRKWGPPKEVEDGLYLVRWKNSPSMCGIKFVNSWSPSGSS